MSDRDRNVDLEAVYAALAEGIDAHGPEHSEMFLAKAALLLAEALGDETARCGPSPMPSAT